MKKFFMSFLVIIFMISSLITPSRNALANDNNENEELPESFINSLESNSEEINIQVNHTVEELYQAEEKTIYEVDVKEEFDINTESFEMIVEESSENIANIYSKIEVADSTFASKFHVNIETGEMSVTDSEVNENGEVKENTYNIFFTEIEGEDFKAILIDRKSDEIYNVNTIDAQASAIPVLAIVLQMGAKWAIKKYGKKALISAFGKYALSNAIKKLPSLVVKSKHLKSDKRTFSKFNTDSQTTSKGWIKEALQKTSVSKFEINNNEKLSFKVDVNLGKKIGTKGETKIRIVIGYDGKIWSAFPVN